MPRNNFETNAQYLKGRIDSFPFKDKSFSEDKFGNTDIYFKAVTIDAYKDKEGKDKAVANYHDVHVRTKDAELIEKLKAVKAGIDAGKKVDKDSIERNVELNGFLANPTFGGEIQYDKLRVEVLSDIKVGEAFDPENKKTNVAHLEVNVFSDKETKKVRSGKVPGESETAWIEGCNNRYSYVPVVGEDGKYVKENGRTKTDLKEYKTRVSLLVNKSDQPDLYQKAVDGTLSTKDKIVLDGTLKDRQSTNKEGKTRYMNTVVIREFEIKVKQAKTETQAKTEAQAPAAEQKPAGTKQARSNRNKKNKGPVPTV